MSSSNQSKVEISSALPDIDIINRLASSTVVKVILGCFSSWAAERLSQRGVGYLVLIDMDDICISRTLTSTIGKSKIHQMKERLLNIYPQNNATTIFDLEFGAINFVTNYDNIYDTFFYDWICLAHFHSMKKSNDVE